MNKLCTNCGRFPFCENINKQACNEWIKQKYLEIKKERIKNEKIRFKNRNENSFKKQR